VSHGTHKYAVEVEHGAEEDRREEDDAGMVVDEELVMQQDKVSCACQVWGEIALAAIGMDMLRTRVRSWSSRLSLDRTATNVVRHLRRKMRAL
jgi:hypothetical protein